jgi:hypothetical protein
MMIINPSNNDDEDRGPAAHQRQAATDQVVESEEGTVEQDPATAQMRLRYEQQLRELRGRGNAREAVFEQPYQQRNYIRWDDDWMFWTKCFPTIFIPITYRNEQGVFIKDIPHSFRRRDVRAKQFTFSEWCNWLMSSYPRFVAHPTLKFVLLNIKNREQSLRTTSWRVNLMDEDQHLTVAQLKDMIDNQQENRVHDIAQKL